MMTVTLGKHLPDFTDEEVYDWFGERGVYSSSVEQFKSCFDIFEHKQGKFTYRLKHRKDWVKFKSIDEKNLFDGIILHDPMESLYLRKYGDEINCIHTHYLSGEDKGETIDVIEN